MRVPVLLLLTVACGPAESGLDASVEIPEHSVQLTADQKHPGDGLIAKVVSLHAPERVFDRVVLDEGVLQIESPSGRTARDVAEVLAMGPDERRRIELWAQDARDGHLSRLATIADFSPLALELPTVGRARVLTVTPASSVTDPPRLGATWILGLPASVTLRDTDGDGIPNLFEDD